MIRRQGELNMKIRELLEARENAGDHLAFVFGAKSDWLIGRHEYSGSITEQS